MRATLFGLLLALVLIIPSSGAYTFEYGCCLPEAGNCIPGDNTVFSSQGAFDQTCGEANGEVNQGAVCATSCEMGCCCAGANVPGSAEINRSEDLLSMTQYACNLQSTQALPYHYRVPGPGQSCVDVCGGAATQAPGSSTYTIKGVVRNAGQPAAGTIRFFATGVQESVTVDSAGSYQKVLPANKRYTITVEPQNLSCRTQSTSLLLDRAITRDFTLDCTGTTGCTNQKPVITNLAVVPGTARATFDISYSNSCSNLDSFVPYACIGDICTPMDRTTERTVTATELAPNTEYCFFARAYNSPTGYVDSAQACIHTGDAPCMQERTGQWCGQGSDGTSAVLACDEKNKLVENRCGEAMICGETTLGPKCIERTECAKCNGLLGLFAKLNIQIPSAFSGFAPSCQQIAAYNDPQCYLEQSFVPAYQACSEVSSCASYTSSDSCSTDGCGIGSCQWRPASGTVGKELGTGVCVGDDLPPCRQCDDAFGYCDKQLCEGISDQCYYDGVENNFYRDGSAACIPVAEMGCRFYDTAAECGTSTVDIRYSENRRVGGTNSRSGTDKFGFGVCQWIAAEGICVKNADNLMHNEGDCNEAGLSGTDLLNCISDNTPPETTFILKEPAIYGSSEITSLPVRVSDNAAGEIRTFVCLSKESCYPDVQLAQLDVPDVTADYKLYYYSIDANFNSEVVKSVSIMVRKDNVTRLSSVRIEERE